MNDLVSIIIPLHNSEKFIGTAIESALGQTYKSFEIIIVSDCPSDKSLEIAKSYADRYQNIKVIDMVTNHGAAQARNVGIQHSSGRFIAFLDSDDVWHPKKLEIQIGYMQSNDVAFCFTAYDKVDVFGNGITTMGVPCNVSYNKLLKTCVIGCSTVVYDVEYIGKVFMPLDAYREDYATWLAILKRIPYAYGINQVLSQYRVYQGQSSFNKILMAKNNWLLYRNIEKLDIFRSTYYFINYAYRGFMRCYLPKVAKFMGLLD